jgi:hypothetical protein
MINIFTKSKKVMETVTIDRTLLYHAYRDYERGERRAQARRDFSPYDFRNHGKHGGIERIFTNVIPSVFSRTIHERNLRSRFRRIFHERGTFAIYERDSVVSLTFVARTWFTNVIPLGVSYEGVTNVNTNVIPCPSELNTNYGLRSPFNWHERGLETEHGTNVELAVIPVRNHGMTLFYHLFYSLMVNGWMLFRISPWESLTAKTHGITVWKTRTWIRFTNALRNHDTVFSIQSLNLGTILQMHYGITNVG